jgi:hypothetical protein
MATRKSKAATPAKKRGRPSKFTPEMYEQAENLCLLGATNDELARFFKVAGSTIDLWIKKNADFSGAIKKGREVADAKVASSLYKRAIGYSHPEDDIRTMNTGLGYSEIVITPTIKHYPPDTAAAFIWLKNRRPDKWRDNTDGSNGTIKREVTAFEVVPYEDSPAIPGEPAAS